MQNCTHKKSTIYNFHKFLLFTTVKLNCKCFIYIYIYIYIYMKSLFAKTDNSINKKINR